MATKAVAVNVRYPVNAFHWKDPSSLVRGNSSHLSLTESQYRESNPTPPGREATTTGLDLHETRWQVFDWTWYRPISEIENTISMYLEWILYLWFEAYM